MEQKYWIAIGIFLIFLILFLLIANHYLNSQYSQDGTKSQEKSTEQKVYKSKNTYNNKSADNLIINTEDFLTPLIVMITICIIAPLIIKVIKNAIITTGV